MEKENLKHSFLESFALEIIKNERARKLLEQENDFLMKIIANTKKSIDGFVKNNPSISIEDEVKFYRKIYEFLLEQVENYFNKPSINIEDLSKFLPDGYKIVHKGDENETNDKYKDN